MAPKYRAALVTGASSGLGRALTLWLVKKGVPVWAVARRADRLQTLCTEAAREGGVVHPVVLDISQSRATLSRLQAADDEAGGLDLVVANAGVSETTRATRMDFDKVDRVIQTNVVGAAATLCALLPRLVERDRGHLVGISSLAAWRGLPGTAAYSASKAFLAVFLESLRVDLRGSGVKVTTIYPGFVKSELTAQNQHRMPFILETDAAVDKMGRAIFRGDAEFAFPWQLTTAMGVAKLLPNPIFDRVTGRGRRRLEGPRQPDGETPGAPGGENPTASVPGRENAPR